MSTKKRVYTVLVIDGGGVRGLIPARMLEEIEKKTGKHTSELFDMIAVTSAGALVGASLTVPSADDPKKPRYTASEVLQTFKREAPNIFPNIKFRNIKHFVPGADGYYDVDNFEKILKTLYGDTKMGESLTDLIVTATDMKAYRPAWIQNIKKLSDKDGWRNMDLWEAVRASCTAPSLFQTKYTYTAPNPNTPDVRERYTFLDGNIFSASAPRYAYSKAKQAAPPDAEIVVVHIGTAFQKLSASPDEFNKVSPMTLLKETVGLMIHMNGTAVLDDLKTEIGDRLFSFDQSIDKYAPSLTPSIRLDDASDKNLSALLDYAERLVEDYGDDLDRLCEILKSKVYVDQAYTQSRAALTELTDILADTKNTKELNIAYTKVVKYSSDVDVSDIPEEDKHIQELAKGLEEDHLNQLDRIVGVLRERKRYQEKPTSKFKNGLKAVFMPWTLWKKKDKPANDNPAGDVAENKPAPQKKKDKGPKR
ncbi:MAG: hypothetical protein EP349_10410 [Alphaproteobacteria bacterium]|nr:MAG: hypothetical protein EP349_10410 [Alphaproteobacteria bacterium]